MNYQLITRQLVVALICVQLLALHFVSAQVQAPKAGPSFTPYFSPQGGCTKAICAELDTAKTEILVQAYAFTSQAIAQSLINAHKRGVTVTVILDAKENTGKTAVTNGPEVLQAGVTVFADHIHNIAHNKIMIIDQSTLITGSFNFTTSAELYNAENILVIKGQPDLIKAYTDNFNLHKSHSVPYKGK